MLDLRCFVRLCESVEEAGGDRCRLSLSQPVIISKRVEEAGGVLYRVESGDTSTTTSSVTTESYMYVGDGRRCSVDRYILRSYLPRMI